MSDKMKYVKIKRENGTYTDAIPVAVDAANVQFPDGRTLIQATQDFINGTDIAVKFNSTEVYNPGDYIYNNQNLYRVLVKHNANVSWDSWYSVTNAEQIVLTDEIKNMIYIGTSQPSNPANKVWINSGLTSTIQIPTELEFENLRDSVAEQYSAKTYSKGEYCINDNKLYRCKADIATAEATFVPSHWQLVNTGDEIYDLKENLGDQLQTLKADMEDEFVRFDAAQNLTAAQKQQARDNIGATTGAVRFDTEQQLTAAQQEQARQNISGASVEQINDLKDDLNENVGDLKSALNGFEDNVNHGVFTPVLEVGDYDIVSGVITPKDRKCYIRVAVGYHLKLDVGDIIGLSSYSGFGFYVFYKHEGASVWSATGKLYADYTVSAKGEFAVTVGANPMDYTVVYTNPYSIGVSVFVRNAHSVKDKIDNVAKQTQAIPYITMEDFMMNVRGGYRSENQIFFVSDDVKSTEIVPFDNKKVSKITAKTRINNTFYKVVFFDENKNIMPDISLVNESSDSVDAVDEIDVTGTEYDNACYVLATTYRPNVYTGKLLTLYSQDYVLKLKEAVGVQYKYPDFSILGDSFSTFASYTVPEENNQWYPNTPTNDVDSVTDTWWYKFGSAKSCVLRQNNSYSGAPICYDGYGTGTIDAKNYCLATRVENLTNASLVIIEGATNDSSVGVGLGEYTYSGWDDTNMIYYRPALAYLLDYAKNHFLGAQIIFMLNNGLNAEIIESTEVICEHYGIPLLKLLDINKQASHPSKAGMTQIADQLIAFLDSLN